ncbi:MAG: hypothetical protein J7K72_04550 [Candidatus Aenigmarchaeota archaeon]|nr:hypothetical protein [Candidatus Aenigmarchaeota archaeon]
MYVVKILANEMDEFLKQVCCCREINYRLVERQAISNEEQCAVAFRRNNEFYITVVSGDERGVKIPIAEEESKNIIREHGVEPGETVYYDHTHPEKSFAIPNAFDLTAADITTKKGKRPVHAVTCYTPGSGIEKLIYQRKEVPNIFSRIASYVSNKTGWKRPFHKRFEKNVMERARNAKTSRELLSIIKEELERTGKYNADFVIINKDVKIPESFKKYSF